MVTDPPGGRRVQPEIIEVDLERERTSSSRFRSCKLLLTSGLFCNGREGGDFLTNVGVLSLLTAPPKVPRRPLCVFNRWQPNYGPRLRSITWPDALDAASRLSNVRGAAQLLYDA